MQTSSIPTNPYAPPRIAAVEAELLQPQSATNRRASEKELQRLCWRLAIAEVSYVFGCTMFIAGLFLFGGNYDLQAAAMFFQYGAFAVTWVCLFSIYRINHGIFRAIAAVVTFPVPLIGSLIFFFWFRAIQYIFASQRLSKKVHRCRAESKRAAADGDQ